MIPLTEKQRKRIEIECGCDARGICWTCAILDKDDDLQDRKWPDRWLHPEASISLKKADDVTYEFSLTWLGKNKC